MQLFRRAAVLAVAIGSSCAASAQDYPGVVDDLAQGYEFADGSSPDILGIALGMPRADALATLRQVYPRGIYVDADYTRHAEDGPSKYAIRYYTGDEAAVPLDDGTMERVAIDYTTAVTGERVAAVERTIAYAANQPGMDAFTDALTEKYGQPSLSMDGTGSGPGRTILYVWYDGVLTPATQEEFVSEQGVGGCRATVTKGQYDLRANPIHPLMPHTDDYPHCTATLYVELTPGPRADLVGNVFSRLTSYRRYYDNAVATDDFMRAGLDQVIAAQGGGAAPAL